MKNSNVAQVLKKYLWYLRTDPHENITWICNWKNVYRANKLYYIKKFLLKKATCNYIFECLSVSPCVMYIIWNSKLFPQLHS